MLHTNAGGVVGWLAVWVAVFFSSIFESIIKLVSEGIERARISDGKDWLLFDYVKRFRHFINLLNEAVIQCRVCVLRPGGVGEVRTFFTICHTAVLKPFIFRQSLRFENVAEMSFIFWLLVGDRRDVERLKRDREECD